MLAVRQGQRAIPGPAAVVAAKVGFSACTLAAYGFHRDELYLQQCGRHLAWGFVDHGPLVPALSFLSLHGFGASPAGARVLSAAAVAATVWTAGRAAQALGGGILAQSLVALLVAIAPLFVYSGGVFGTNAFDQLFWTLAGLCALRAANGERRWVPWLGVCLGLGILAKPTMILGAVSLFAALLACGKKVRLRSFWIALPIAAAIASPLAIWEQMHGWPGLAFIASHGASLGQTGARAVFLDQLRLLGPFSCAAVVAGVWSALRRGAEAPLRVAALPFLFALAAVAAAGGKPYYASAAAPLAMAAGAVALAQRVLAWPRLSALALGLAAIVQCAAALPLLPRARLLGRFHPDLVQFADWTGLVGRIASLHQAAGLPSDAPVLTDSYGTAAALQRFGGLPALSGANAFGAWAWEERRDEPDALLAIGYPPALLRRFFLDVQPAGLVEAADGGDNRFDFPRQAWLCRGRTASLRAGWAAFTHFE